MCLNYFKILSILAQLHLFSLLWPFSLVCYSHLPCDPRWNVSHPLSWCLNPLKMLSVNLSTQSVNHKISYNVDKSDYKSYNIDK